MDMFYIWYNSLRIVGTNKMVRYGDEKNRMLVRTCEKCREYVIIHINTEAQLILRKFEKSHKGHPVKTTILEDLVCYDNFKKKYACTKKPLESAIET